MDLSEYCLRVKNVFFFYVQQWVTESLIRIPLHLCVAISFQDPHSLLESSVCQVLFRARQSRSKVQKT